jgi:hypothetical protein
MYAKVVPHKRRVGAIVVAAAIAAAILVTLAGGATAAIKHKAVTHHPRTTAHLEQNNPTPSTRDVGSPAPGTRDVGFTG